jgi:four helix bundle protein
MRVFELTQLYPKEERYSLVDQFRRSSRSICANIAEAWRKRRYPSHFVSKLSDAEAEAAESLVWCDFSVRCGYIDQVTADELTDRFDKIIRQLVLMISHPEKWRV